MSSAQDSGTKSKGNAVTLATFLKCQKQDVIGHEIEEIDGKKMVNFVWCKVCAKTSALSFINGTNFVTSVLCGI